jgi:hypothetical protein
VNSARAAAAWRFGLPDHVIRQQLVEGDEPTTEHVCRRRCGTVAFSFFFYVGEGLVVWPCVDPGLTETHFRDLFAGSRIKNISFSSSFRLSGSFELYSIALFVFF